MLFASTCSLCKQKSIHLFFSNSVKSYQLCRTTLKHFLRRQSKYCNIFSGFARTVTCIFGHIQNIFIFLKITLTSNKMHHFYFAISEKIWYSWSRSTQMWNVGKSHLLNMLFWFGVWPNWNVCFSSYMYFECVLFIFCCHKMCGKLFVVRTFVWQKVCDSHFLILTIENVEVTSQICA